MNQVERLRLEKVAADCGFEMTPGELADGIEMRSARFPEAVLVRMIGYEAFHVTATDPFILGMSTSAIDVGGFGELYKVLRAAAVLARTRPNRVANEFRERGPLLFQKIRKPSDWSFSGLGRGSFGQRCSITGKACAV